MMKRLYILFAFLSAAIAGHAQDWTTLFAYNNVSQIALVDDRVFAVSDGSLFSVDGMSEQITKYDTQTGLHGSGVLRIHYDAPSCQLLIAYTNGKLDVLGSHGVTYVGGLYDKDITSEKTIYNFTSHGHMVYLSTHFGIVTMDMRTNTLVDTYLIGYGSREKRVDDTRIVGDSIYAFTSDSLYVGSLADNLSDYHVWHSERKGRIAPEPRKGYTYIDAYGNVWSAGGAEGVVRQSLTGERTTYKPDGPLNNVPAYLTIFDGTLYMLSGGYWSNHYRQPGHIMIFDGTRWHNIAQDDILNSIGGTVRDLTGVAMDPQNPTHMYITSYGTGLYEFFGQDSIIRHLPDTSNTLGSAAPGFDDNYTRMAFPHMDNAGRFWAVCAGDVTYPIVIRHPDGHWSGLSLVDGAPISLNTPGGLILDNQDSTRLWASAARSNTCVIQYNHGGTIEDTSDDAVFVRTEWTDQHGVAFKPLFIYNLYQDRRGNVWMVTDQGLAYIAAATDFTVSDACVRVHLTIDSGEDMVLEMARDALTEDAQGRLWVGTATQGIYVLDADGLSVVEHITSTNSGLPSDAILSLVYDAVHDYIYVGTADGLVVFGNLPSTTAVTDSDEATEPVDEGVMLRWRLHPSYTTPNEVVLGDRYVYTLSDGTIYAVDKLSEEIVYLNKSTGLTSANVGHIAYDHTTGQLLIYYKDGRLDLVAEASGEVRSMPDLYLKAANMSVQVNAIQIHRGYAYLATTFGVVCVNLRKAEFADTYYIGPQASLVDVESLAVSGDSIYAVSKGLLYAAALSDPLVDYSYWHVQPLPDMKTAVLASSSEGLYLLQNGQVYLYSASAWQPLVSTLAEVEWIHATTDGLLYFVHDTGLYLHTPIENRFLSGYLVNDAAQGAAYWLGTRENGLMRLSFNGDVQFYVPEGPLSNFGYTLHAAGERMYVLQGGRWADAYARPGGFSFFEDEHWHIVPRIPMIQNTGSDIRDMVSIAVDPKDASHYFVACYGTGLIEFKDDQALVRYGVNNSTIRAAATDPGADYYYTRTEGLMFDAEGNLWVLNPGEPCAPVHVRTPQGQWTALSPLVNGQTLRLTTPKCMMADYRTARYKWFIEQRGMKGVILLDDGGTPTYAGDDRCVVRNQFVDEDNKVITPNFIYSIAQDLGNNIWIGTQEGILVIPPTVDYFTSNKCRRIKIPRNDGTNLADYLLDKEQINCIVVDGGNRKWIGTENSGLYLMSEDGLVTLQHFTVDNSLLPSNSVQSIAILPRTGEVFVGTSGGIASYRSDASEPREDFSSAYAYPNPVRPNYRGAVSITGLMADTEVTIIDAAGNTVFKTRANGGTAVWDGCTAKGQRAKSGVYTALCNAASGGHTVVKILFID